MPRTTKSGRVSLSHLKKAAFRWLGRFWRRSLWYKFLLIFASTIILLTGVFYGIGEWYTQRHKNQPLVLGASFIADYAQALGVNPQQTLSAMLNDLNMKHVRLVSYWNRIEKTPGVYDFSALDGQFALANQYGAKVSLAIGLRQPRWPECHAPDWVMGTTKSFWQPALYKFIGAVVDHYKNNSALSDYELENEFFMKVFGECTDFDRQRLVEELALVKQHDTTHKVIISRSDNWVGIPVGRPVPDEFAISVYKRVWDAAITHRYFEYPLPPWFYAGLAGSEEIWSGKDMIIHELQAEPWPATGQFITDATLTEQFKSMDAKRMKSRIAYGESTGMRTIDLWGAEWWYWLKEKHRDPSVWNVVKDAVAKAEARNQKLASQT